MNDLEEYFGNLSLESEFLDRSNWKMKFSKKLKTKYYLLIPFKLFKNPLGCKNWKNEISVNFISRFSNMKFSNNNFKDHYDLIYVRFYYDKIKKNKTNEDGIPITYLKLKKFYIPEDEDIKVTIASKITVILREEKNEFIPGKNKIERFLLIPHKKEQRNFYEKYKINDHILAFITHLIIIEKKYRFEKKIIMKSENGIINSFFPEMGFIKALYIYSTRTKITI